LKGELSLRQYDTPKSIPKEPNVANSPLVKCKHCGRKIKEPKLDKNGLCGWCSRNPDATQEKRMIFDQMKKLENENL
jgi:hypothetical protein